MAACPLAAQILDRRPAAGDEEGANLLLLTELLLFGWTIIGPLRRVHNDRLSIKLFNTIQMSPFVSILCGQ